MLARNPLFAQHAPDARIEPAGGDAIVRFVPAGVVFGVVLGRQQEARAPQGAHPVGRLRGMRPLVDLRIAIAAQKYPEHERQQ
jgi:hypothetical protein